MNKYNLLIVLFQLLFNCISVAQIPSLIINKLDKDFYVYTTYQTFDNVTFPANGLYVVTKDGIVLIDTPWDSTQFQVLLDQIETKHGQKVKLCISTHSHSDRTGGLEYYTSGGIKTYTSKATDLICAARNEKRAQFTFDKDTTFTLGDLTFDTFHPGAGHAPDNIVIYFRKARILYGGCFVKSIEAMDLGNLADANVPVWEKSMKNVMAKYKKPRFIIPGHQDWKSKDALRHTMKLIRRHLEMKQTG